MYTDFGITIDPAQHLFVATKNKVYLTSPEYLKIHETIYVQKTGIPLYEIGACPGSSGKRGNYKPRHEIGNILGHLATKNTYDLSDEEAELYANRRDVSIKRPTENINSRIILTRKKHGFSIGKLVD